MEELIELLKRSSRMQIFENCDTFDWWWNLIPLQCLSIVSELQDTYDITITPADIIPENLTLQKHCGIWCADWKIDLYKADNWNYNPVVCFSIEKIRNIMAGKISEQ